MEGRGGLREARPRAAGRPRTAPGRAAARGPAPPGWSTARWGPPAAGPGLAGAELAEAEALETLMRATLGALASFSEGERALLLRAFDTVLALRRERGEFQPEGLVDGPLFRAAWASLGVRVTPAGTALLFRRHGMDREGRMPYGLFAQRLLESPARQAGYARVRRGAFEAGVQATHRGKILYPPCRTGVFPPSDWSPHLAERSGEKPGPGLKLEFVYGYAGLRNNASNLFYTKDGRVVYYTAGVGIVYDRSTHSQEFFKGHDDDVSCLAMHPERQLVASGQVAGLGETGNCPYVCIWDVGRTGKAPTLVQRFDFDGEGEISYRMIVALGFSACGQRLTVVTGDNKHSLFVFEWKSKRCIFQGVGQNGAPPRVFGVHWNPYLRSGTGPNATGYKMFVTRGVKHLKFWHEGGGNGGPAYTATLAKFAPKAQVADVFSAAFIDADTLVTGSESGELLTWDATGKRGRLGCCIRVVKAHGPGKGFVDPESRLRYHGVRCLKVRRGGTELLSAGADGRVVKWDITRGKLGGQLGVVEVKPPGQKDPVAFRALDSFPGSEVFMAGTSHCDIWEVDADPEVLIYGHTADLYGCCFHPNKPHRFVTVCESSSIFVWNAKKRQLSARCSVRAKARMACISPDGRHLAVGCAGGRMRVLLMENLKETVADKHEHLEAIDEMAYSPDGTRLVTGSHDNYMHLYDVQRDYALVQRCQGHSSYITHIDWSADSSVFKSTCGAYEILYWSGRTGKQIINDQRDQSWATCTCTLGFGVMGIWPDGSDGTDVNAVDRSNQDPRFVDTDPLAGLPGQVLVTSGDDGSVRVFNYPCVVEDAPCRKYIGHSSHVMMARFSPDNRWVITTGGHDRAVFQWAVERDGRDQAGVPSTRAEVENFVFEPPKRQLTCLSENVADRPAGANKAGAPTPKQGDAHESVCEYIVTTWTTDVKGAGTDARVSVVLFGASENSESLALEGGKSSFKRGGKDTFKVKAADIGPVERIRIGHDNSSGSPGWHLDRVSVQNVTTNTKPVEFPCAMWFAVDEGDGKTARVLTPDGVQGARARSYSVQVRTGTQRGAGTSANVYLTIFGTDGTSGELKLETSRNNFERGRTDEFTVECSVGEIQRIRVGHDNSGAGPGWYLDQITIMSSGQKPLVFDCDDWLDSSAGDGQTSRTLFPHGSGDAKGRLCRYKVEVLTSDLRGAGTDANVWIDLLGETSRSGKRPLETSRNNFERGREDVFHLETVDLGRLLQIDIGHDNAGLGGGWHLAQVGVTNEKSGDYVSFPCDRWLTKEDGTLNLLLEPMDIASGKTNFRVDVFTTDKKFAGTDARVSCILHGVLEGGERVSGERIPLETSRNNFERNRQDTFLLKKHKLLGDLEAITIGHDNRGIGAGWHLDHVEVVDEGTGKEYYFPCEAWLDKNEGDGLIERRLSVAKQGTAKDVSRYKITVNTSDVKFSGCDANVSAEIVGDRGSSGELVLSNSKNNFERGASDVFTFKCKNLGVIERCIIGHDNSGIGAAWHLDSVEVLSVDTMQEITFPHRGWLSLKEPPYKTRVVLLPADQNRQDLLCNYRIKVATSDIRFASTTADVFCILHGECGSTSSLPLSNSKDNFQRGAEDEFTVEAFNVGKVAKVEIGHNSRGVGAAWHLQHVEVVNAKTGEREIFLCNLWLDKTNGDKLTTRTLLPGSSSKVQSWRLAVKTLDRRGSGTDADIAIVFNFERGPSAEIPLESSANDFERDRVDEFLVDVGQEDLGPLESIEIGFAEEQSVGGRFGSLLGKSWGLEYVEALHVNTGETVHFFYSDFVEAGKVKLSPGKDCGSEKNPYLVQVQTSDLRGASLGFSSEVSVVVFGSEGDSGVQKLENSSRNFERAALDTFTFECSPLGTLERVQVQATGRGFGAAWHLQHVIVKDMNGDEEATFVCNRWFDTTQDPSSGTQVLVAGDVSLELIDYTVKTYTSDRRFASTTAGVTLQLFGDKDHTGPRPLEGSSKDFERGGLDEFSLEAVDVGKIDHIVVAHDNRGLSPAWHLSHVEILHPLLGQTYFFNCDGWLQKTEEEGMGGCQRTLKPGSKEGAPTRYKISVKTGDARGAGTSADVSITVFGSLGDSGERLLDTSANDFERGAKDHFFFECTDIGAFQRVEIGHNGRGMFPAWLLDSVEVTHLGTGVNALFPHAAWLDTKSGERVTLHPDMDGDGQGDVQAAGYAHAYAITVFTGDAWGAGSGGKVSMELHGTKGFIGETVLDNGSGGFKRNSQQSFEIYGTDVGEPTSMVVRLKGGGLGAKWHLNQVDVLNQNTGVRGTFIHGGWIEPGEDEGVKIEEARCGGGAGGAAAPGGSEDGTAASRWKCVTYTGNVFGAGTDSQIFLEVRDGAGNLLGGHPIELARSAVSGNAFERGNQDVFFFDVAPENGLSGEIAQVAIERKTSFLPGGDWKLDHFVLVNTLEGTSLKFNCDAWLSKKTGLRKEWSRERHAAGEAQDLQLVPGAASWDSGQNYSLAFTTSKRMGASSNAKVSVLLVGSEGEWEPVLDQKREHWQSGATDTFVVNRAKGLGDVESCKVWHDGAGWGAGWHLQDLVVEHLSSGRQWAFHCTDWVPAGRGNAKVLNVASRGQAGELPQSDGLPDGANMESKSPGSPPGLPAPESSEKTAQA